MANLSSRPVSNTSWKLASLLAMAHSSNQMRGGSVTQHTTCLLLLSIGLALLFKALHPHSFSEGHCHGMLQTGRLQQQEFISHTSRGCKDGNEVLAQSSACEVSVPGLQEAFSVLLHGLHAGEWLCPNHCFLQGHSYTGWGPVHMCPFLLTSVKNWFQKHSYHMHWNSWGTQFCS